MANKMHVSRCRYFFGSQISRSEVPNPISLRICKLEEGHDRLSTHFNALPRQKLTEVEWDATMLQEQG